MKLARLLKRLALPFLVVCLLVFASLKTEALQLVNRSVLVGNPMPSATTSHTFLFDIATAGTLGSIQFEYCSTDPLIGSPCSAPAGLDVSGATLTSQTGEIGFGIHAATNANHLILARVPVAASTGAVTYSFDNVINPSTPDVPVFIRIYTFQTDDATGPYTDAGAVIYNTAGQLSASGFVPPYITACVGISVALDCSSTSGSLANFGNLTTGSTSAVTSQMSVATNDPTGYLTYVFGSTLTSGNNAIPALVAPSASNPGTGQFGLNLRANADPVVGADPQGVGTGAPAGGYNTPDQYQFVNNSVVASSAFPTEFNRYTVSYITNISGSQSPGAYASTITYVAIAASF